MADKKGKGAKGRKEAKSADRDAKRPVEPEVPEARVKLPPGSIQVMGKRDREWLDTGKGTGPSPPGSGTSGTKAPSVADMQRRRGEDRNLIGKRMVDADGLELGFVDEVHGENITVGEGPFGDWLKITKSYLGDVDDEIHLLEPLQDLLEDLEVVDSKGRRVGKVKEVVATGDVVDGLVVETDDDELYVLLEDICCIGGDLSLDITYEALKKQEANRKKVR